MIKAPCYDPKTDTLCTSRRVGCRSECKAWKEYEAKKQKEYAHRQKERQLESDLQGYVNTRSKRIRRRHHFG